MAELPIVEQRALVEQFAPVLLLHPDEKFYPVDPKRYLEACALWRAAAEDGVEPLPKVANLGDIKLWGKRPRGSKATFPRKPSVAQGTLRGLAAEQVPGTVWLGAASDPDTSAAGELPSVKFPFQDPPGLLSETWLDPAGWLASEDVTDKSDNTRANLPEIQQQWDNEAPSNPRIKGRFWYTAEVIDQAGMAILLRLTASRLQDDRSQLLNDLVKNLDGLEDVQLLVYHYFYPAHEDLVLKPDQPAGTPPTLLRTYGGDWTSVAMLVARDNPILPGIPSGPWTGKLIATTRRKFDFLELSSALRHDLDVRPWADPELTRLKDTHPVIFVALGLHSNQLTAGNHPTLAVPPSSETVDKINQAIDGAKRAVDDANDFVDGIDTSRDVVVLLAKVAAGASLFGAFGAVLGLVAGIIEAVSTSPPDFGGTIGGKIDPDQFKGEEVGPATTPVGSTTTGIGKALLPPGVTLSSPLSGNLAGKSGQLLAKESRVWQCSTLTDPATGVFTDPAATNRQFFQLMQRQRTGMTQQHQTWWPAQKTVTTAETDDPGYRGRWGVRVADKDDPLGTQSGMIWPDAALALTFKLIQPPTGA